MKAGLVDSEPGRGVALGIEIDQEGLAIGESEPGREIDGSRRLADAALLVDDGDRRGYAVTQSCPIVPACRTDGIILRATPSVFHDSHSAPGPRSDSSRRLRVFHDSHETSPVMA
jgi:hypothetical protein